MDRRSIRRCIHPLLRNRDHSGSGIARHNFNPAIGQVERVDPGTAIDLQNTLTFLERPIQRLPNRTALGAADRGGRESIVVRFGDNVEFCVSVTHEFKPRSQ
jgi:hypothetical protein